MSSKYSQQTRLWTYESIVQKYIAVYSGPVEKEMRWFATQSDLEKTVEVATLSVLPKGKRHPHQRRIPQRSLAQAWKRLRAEDLARPQCFDSLHQLIREKIGGIHGIGALTVYDVATRIGAYRGLKPGYVYLHAGTREGARALGLMGKDGKVEVSLLPAPYRKLTPGQIEDCLCIYKDEIRAIAASLRKEA